MKNYSIPMLVLMVTLAVACKKNPQSKPTSGASHTAHMGGTRTWHVRYWGETRPDFDTASHYDTTYERGISITIVDDSTVIFFASDPPLKYMSSDSDTHSILFGYGDVYSPRMRLTYYYLVDSMHYTSEFYSGHMDRFCDMHTVH